MDSTGLTDIVVADDSLTSAPDRVSIDKRVDWLTLSLITGNILFLMFAIAAIVWCLLRPKKANTKEDEEVKLDDEMRNQVEGEVNSDGQDNVGNVGSDIVPIPIHTFEAASTEGNIPGDV